MAVSGSEKALGLVGVSAEGPAQSAAAASLSAQLGLPVVPVAAHGVSEEPHAEALMLVVTADRLELRGTKRRGPGAVFAEFVGGQAGRRLRAARHGSELLARAAGLTSGGSVPPSARQTVLDATAGLGFDSSLLAVLGAEVLAVERHAVVAALLADGLQRALATPDVAARLGGRLQLRRGESRELLAELMRGPDDARPDIVTIDPMFPPGRGSAASRKEMQLFHRLLGDDADAAELLPVARACARRRVVVKRPRHAPVLAGQAPDITYAGSSTRFDVYVTHERPRPASTRPTGA